MFDVIGIGRNCVDYLSLVDGLPREDTKVPVLEHLVEGGGQASTALAALARLGLKTAFAGLIGDDDPGRWSLCALEREGVDVSLVRVVPGLPTPAAQILVNTRTGSRTIAYLDSLAGCLSPDLFSREDLLSCRLLLIDPFGASVGAALAPEALSRGIPVIFDAERSGPFVEEMLDSCSHAVAAAEIVSALGAGSPDEALSELYRRGDKTAAVITLGKEGSIGLGPEGFFRQAAFPVEVVDTTAAGDAYHAGFAYGVLRGWSLPRAMACGSALGAQVCRGLGGRSPLPRREEVAALLGKDWDA